MCHRPRQRDGEKIEMKRVLNSHEYARLMACADTARHLVRTHRARRTSQEAARRAALPASSDSVTPGPWRREHRDQ